MVAKKKKGRRQGMLSKAINAALIALGFSRVLTIIFGGGDLKTKMDRIITGATFGLSKGKFDLHAGLVMYTPAGAAIGLGKLKQYLMKKFPVR